MVISVDNRFVMEISFNDQTERTVNFPFGKDNEHTATLEISRGRVRMLPFLRSFVRGESVLIPDGSVTIIRVSSAFQIGL